jgi:hypothetical protein
VEMIAHGALVLAVCALIAPWWITRGEEEECTRCTRNHTALDLYC